MASPQVEDGYTRLANELLEALMRINLSAYQSRVILAVIRKTYGFGKKEDRISNSQLVELTGIHKAHISRTIKELKAAKIVTQAGNKLAFNKDYQGWAELPKRVTVTPLGNSVTPLGNKSYPVGRTQKKKENIQKKVLSESDLSLFHRFYEAYPLHKGKQPAIKAFTRLNPQNGTLETILTALEAQKAQRSRMKAAGQWCPEWPHPATWLNERRWEDEVPGAGTSNEETVSPIEAYKRREGLS